MTRPPSIEDLLDAFVDQQLADDHLADTLRRWGKRPVRLSISNTLNGARIMQFPDSDTVDAVIAFSDRFGDTVPEPGPITWGVSDAALAEVTVDPSDDTKATVKALAGAGTFQVTATSGTLSGSSEDLTITPGAAVSAAIAVTLEPPSP